MNHLFLAALDSEADLKAELAVKFPGSHPETVHPDLIQATFDLNARSKRLPQLAFAQQFLPFSNLVRNESIRGWAEFLGASIIQAIPENQPWALHVEPHYGSSGTHKVGARAWHSAKLVASMSAPKHGAAPFVHREAGKNRSQLIREATLELLKKKRRHLVKTLANSPAPHVLDSNIVQLVLTSPDSGYLSIAPSPLPFTNRHLLSPFTLGYLEPASDPAAPSRAFAKVIEAEQRLGCSINHGQTCVDLGAAPGSWTYVAALRSARVIAVDRAPLRQDLMSNPLVHMVQHDAFTYVPEQRVDWLLCDVIAEAQYSAGMLLGWLEKRWCKHFIVTLKLKGGPNLPLLADLEPKLDAFCSQWAMKKLCANKKELTVFGTAKASCTSPP